MSKLSSYTGVHLQTAASASRVLPAPPSLTTNSPPTMPSNEKVRDDENGCCDAAKRQDIAGAGSAHARTFVGGDVDCGSKNVIPKC